VFDALDDPNDIERGVRDRQIGGVGANQPKRSGISSCTIQPPGLSGLPPTDSQTRDPTTPVMGQPTSRSAIAAADVDHMLAATNRGAIG
jgi:hypothetical protein